MNVAPLVDGVVRKIAEAVQPKQIILFGSRAGADARPDSDMDLLIIYDDMDLPLGSIRLRAGGGAGGHKGIRSIIEALGTEDVPRIRVGIGRDVSGRQDAVDYVLSQFTEEEREVLKKVTATVSEAVLCALAEGIETAMNRFN